MAELEAFDIIAAVTAFDDRSKDPVDEKLYYFICLFWFTNNRTEPIRVKNQIILTADGGTLEARLLRQELYWENPAYWHEYPFFSPFGPPPALTSPPIPPGATTGGGITLPFTCGYGQVQASFAIFGRENEVIGAIKLPPFVLKARPRPS